MTTFFSWQHAVRSAKLEPTTKLVCYTIWSHMASDGTGCFPSYALIAEESGLSRRSVIEHVQKAEKAGFLQIDARQRDNGSASSNMYRPTMPAGGEPAALGGERGSLGGGEPAAPPEDTTLSNNPVNTPIGAPKQTKASTRAVPRTSIAVLLEELASITDDLRAAATGKHHIVNVDDEWAKFRNHHISACSKHTRIDLCWDTWCRNAAKWQRGSKAPVGGGTGQGGYKRYDHVASAVNSAMVDLYGVQYEGHGGKAAQSSDESCPFPDGPAPIDAVFVDVGPSTATGEAPAGASDRSGADCTGGGALPFQSE